MSKIIFWLVVIFAVMFVLRLVNSAKARRRQAQNGSQSRNAPSTAAMVRCVRCGVFLPRADALPSPNGFTCGDEACAKSH
jgi:hypothetical protein